MWLQEKIKELRSNKGISQKKLADAIGVAQSSINYWEKGQRTPSVAAAQKLADYFNITLDELYDIDNIPESVNTLAAHFNGDEYTPEELEEIRQFAEFVKSKRKDAADHLQVNAAHARTDIDIPEGADTSDNDIMDDNNF